MKRFLLYAMMTAGVLASCSQGEMMVYLKVIL